MRDFFRELTLAAAADFPGASCGIVVMRDYKVDPVAHSDSRAFRLDTAELDGPHRLAAEQRGTVYVADVSSDVRWPEFRDRSLTEAVGSTITSAVEIDEDEEAVGLLTLYSPERHTFDATERQTRMARLCAEAGRALSLAARLETVERSRWRLRSALTQRAVIDYAIGITMVEHRCGPDAAFARLRDLSQARNVKLRTVAKEIVVRVGGEPSPPPDFR